MDVIFTSSYTFKNTYEGYMELEMFCPMSSHDQLRYTHTHGRTHVYTHRAYCKYLFLLHNTIIECIWTEVNHRVNYPLKKVVIGMEEQCYINMEDQTTKLCVSFVVVALLDMDSQYLFRLGNYIIFSVSHAS